jgi:hypothetical protein
MHTIVISDLHHRFEWVEYYLAAHEHDEVIFLGDYFDNLHDSPEDAAATAKWLKESLQQPRRVHLLGNHDIWYGYGCAYAACADNTPQKKAAIAEILHPGDWDKMELCHFSQNFLFSHAGIHEHWFSHPVHGVYAEYVLRICSMGRRNLALGNPDPIFMAGSARGGSYGRRPGGITWLDFKREFKPIHGLNQIVGHTPYPSPHTEGAIKWMPNKIKPRSTNYCVDYHNKWVTHVVDGIVSFEKSPLHS